MKFSAKIFLAIFLLVGVFPLGIRMDVVGQSSSGETQPEFTSELVSKQISIYREFNNDSIVSHKNDTEMNSYSYEYDSYLGEDDYYHVWENRVNYTCVFNNYINRTYDAYFRMDLDFEMYEVKIQYEDRLSIFSYALKNLTMDAEYNQTYERVEEDINQTCYHKYQRVEKIYEDETRTTLIDEIVNETRTDEQPYESENSYEILTPMFMNQTVELSAPLIFIIQVFTTEDGDRIAWADLMWDYFIFDDINEDGIFNTGLNSYMTSSEFKGSIIPGAYNQTAYNEDGNQIQSFQFPNDTNPSDLSPFVQFSNPSESNGIISWNIEYKNFPTAAITPTYYTPFCSYEDSPKNNYSFYFDFSAKTAESKIDMTSKMDFLETENDEFYDAVKNLELCFPHSTYIISSLPVDQEFPTVMTNGMENIIFESENGKVAEIDLANEKKPYILYNHSNNDIPLRYDSVGASVSKLLSSAMEGAILPQSGDNWFKNIIFSLENVIKNDNLIGAGMNRYKFISIATQNYPKWSGNAFYHDPSFKVYFEEIPTQTTPNGEIGIPNIIGLVSALMIGFFMSLLLIEKKFKTND